MLIILEGQERSGKTTLAASLEKALKKNGCEVESVKFDRCEDVVVGMIKNALPMALDPIKIYIMDRGHVTEIIGRTIDGSLHKRSRQYHYLFALDALLTKLRAVHVYLFANEETIRFRHWKTDRKPVGDFKKVREINDANIRLSDMKFHEYDTTNFSAESIVRDIVRKINRGAFFV